MLNIEKSFITELLVSQDMATVVDKEISQKYLKGVYKRVFKYIQDHSTKYGKLPSIPTVIKKFPTLKLDESDGVIGTEETVDYWCDELRNKYKHNFMVDSTSAIMEDLNELETDKAYDEFKKVVLKVENEIVLSDKVEVNRNTNKRWEDYQKRRKSGGMTGLPTGVQLFDGATGGLNMGELIAIMGFTGLGKTWFILIMAVYLAKMGYRVLFFTTEMSTKMIIRRIDALWCKLHYERFKKGQLLPDEEKRYKKHLETIEGDTDANLIVEQATGGVSQISAKIDQHKPDVIFIDGAYLLADEESEDDNWMSVVRVYRALHRLCLIKNKPIITTTQSKDETGTSLKSLSFAKAISNECDIVGALEQDEQMKNDKEIDFRFLKLREGDGLSRIRMNWDFNSMDYSCIYKEHSSDKPEEPTEKAQGVITLD